MMLYSKPYKEETWKVRLSYFCLKYWRANINVFWAEYLFICQAVKNTRYFTDPDWQRFLTHGVQRERTEHGKNSVRLRLKWWSVGSPLKSSKIAFFFYFFLSLLYTFSYHLMILLLSLLKLHSSQNICCWGSSRRYSQQSQVAKQIKDIWVWLGKSLVSPFNSG